MTRTLTPRFLAAITALSSVASVNRNMRMLSAFFAPVDGLDKGLHGVVGKNDQLVRHD